MKPRNFPGRKVIRQIEAERRNGGYRAQPYSEEELRRINNAQEIRTKKKRN